MKKLFLPPVAAQTSSLEIAIFSRGKRVSFIQNLPAQFDANVQECAGSILYLTIIYLYVSSSGAGISRNTRIFVSVLNELEGLARGADARDCPPASRAALDPEHVARVAESAKTALAFARSRNPGIRCLTTRGTVLTSSVFTMEEDVDKVSRLLSSQYCPTFRG